MNGSEKQIKWAEDIKATAIVTIEQFRDSDVPAMMTKAMKQGMDEATAQARKSEFDSAISKTLAVLSAQTDARWWIDRSNNISAKHWMREAGI